MNALHEQFIVEARELIHQAVDDLIAAEREGFSGERIDRVFRAFHTLKGSAGVVELPPMSLTLHAAEDLLAAIHAGRLSPTAAIIDHALACLDQVSRWVDDFEAHESLPSQAGEEAQAMAARLRRLLPTGKEVPATSGVNVAAPAGAQQDWIGRLIEAAGEALSGRAREGSARLTAVSYEPRSDCFFDGDDPLALMRQIPDLLAFRFEPRNAWPPLAELDPFACNLRLQAIAATDQATLARIFRLVPDQVRIAHVPVEALPREHAIQTSDGTDDLVRAVIEEQRRILGVSDPARADFAGRIGAATRSAANALRYRLKAELAERIEGAGSAAIQQKNLMLLLSALDEALAVSAGLPDAGAGPASPAGPRTDGAGLAGARSLRVDETKIDALVNLAGELIVAKNSFAHLARRAESEAGDPALARAIRHNYDGIERVAAEMHAAILQLRMIPVAQVFRSFPRLVRDMSQRLGKDVVLVTRGDTTESDKSVVDRLFEPLLHLVRNAVDHGIESPEQRRAAGKTVTATVMVRAARVSDRLVVEVDDDGHGIDPTMVRHKASERGLLAADELAALSDEQVVDLIFSAGFSTAAEVSDISGRGVGMDVVRTTVEQIGGRVSVTSRAGAGTTVRLDLPVNIAMSRIMVVEAGGQVLGIPMDAVTETVRLPPDRIGQIKNNEGFVLRDRIVPICSLAELMRLPKRPIPVSDARLLVVTEMNGKITALEVDAIRDRLEVVLKPMQGLLANARGYAGTTLLGGGEVLLVLDLKEIVP
jgi:two-component system, chemotaxis family, sensor kinase CheA